MATTSESMRTERPGREVVITRVIKAPKEKLWKAWTDPQLFRRWWGPTEHTAPVAEAELRVGGKFRSSMRDRSGNDIWSTGTFREIEEPRRLVYGTSFSDPEGRIVPASYYGMKGDWPRETTVEVTLEDVREGTKMTVRHRGLPDDENSRQAEEGWNQSFDKLEDELLGTRGEERGPRSEEERRARREETEEPEKRRERQ